MTTIPQQIARRIDRISARGLIRFAAFAQCKTFERAADFLGCTRSGIAAAVNKLEDELGVTLYTSRRSSTLTEAGEHLAAMLGAIFEDLDKTLDQTKELK